MASTKTARHTEKIVKLKEEMHRLEALEAHMLATPGQQISLTDPDSRSMATSARGSGVVGYNVQAAVDTAGPGNHRPDGSEARHALTIKLNHSAGADQFDEP